jgi:hypothetical protein
MSEQQQKAAGVDAAKTSSDKVEDLERATRGAGSLEIEHEQGVGTDSDEHHDPVVRPARDRPAERDD